MARQALPSIGGKSFEALRQVNNHDAEYWSARDLQPLLGYSQWRRFEDAIKRAISSCEQSGHNPEVDWVRTPEEEQAGFPLCPVAKPGHEAELKQRTLTKLYNARPPWLAHAHRELDAAVAAAYGRTDYTPEMPDEEILRRLLALNLGRAETERQLEIGRRFIKERHAVFSKLAE